MNSNPPRTVCTPPDPVGDRSVINTEMNTKMRREITSLGEPALYTSAVPLVPLRNALVRIAKEHAARDNRKAKPPETGKPVLAPKPLRTAHVISRCVSQWNPSGNRCAKPKKEPKGKRWRHRSRAHWRDRVARKAECMAPAKLAKASNKRHVVAKEQGAKRRPKNQLKPLIKMEKDKRQSHLLTQMLKACSLWAAASRPDTDRNNDP